MFRERESLYRIVKSLSEMWVLDDCLRIVFVIFFRNILWLLHQENMSVTCITCTHILCFEQKY